MSVNGENSTRAPGAPALRSWHDLDSCHKLFENERREHRHARHPDSEMSPEEMQRRFDELIEQHADG